MPTMWNEEDRALILRRMDRISPPRAPRWGTMTVEQMVAHVTAQLELALGDLAVRPYSSWIGRWPMREVAIHWAPWPRGAPTAPELLRPPSGQWEDVRQRFKQSFERVAERGPDGQYAPHPLFGRISSRSWGVLMYRHLDHHIRQFGE